MVKLPWRDTLFSRLFLLLWAALVLSHAVAFVVVTQVAIPLTKPRVAVDGAAHVRSPVVFPSLPPTGVQVPVDAPPLRDAQGLPLPLLLLDYAIRLLVMGLAAWWGSRWLTQPVDRLVSAAHAMGTALEKGLPPTPLNDKDGTVEAQQAAAVFNRLSMDLYRDFRSRELLFATVSHDLRTPMTRMRLRLESQPGPDEVAQCIRDIAEMDALVRSALDLVRNQCAAGELQPTRLDVLLQAVADDYAEMGKPIALRESVDAAPATALADPLALRRVLDNVIQNALRHAAHVTLSLEVAPELQAVTIVVEDDGPGVSPAQLVGVQAPSPMLDPAPGSVHGTGLGLYIAHDLMRLQGGSLVLSNPVGGGLQVRIRLAQVDHPAINL